MGSKWVLTTWEEHGSFSLSGKSMAFISSRADSSWAAPESKAGTLRTELYLMNQAGEVSRLTDFNAMGDPNKNYLTSDFDWDRAGKRIAFQVAPVNKNTGTADSPQIWILTFPEPQ